MRTTGDSGPSGRTFVQLPGLLCTPSPVTHSSEVRRSLSFPRLKPAWAHLVHLSRLASANGSHSPVTIQACGPLCGRRPDRTRKPASAVTDTCGRRAASCARCYLPLGLGAGGVDPPRPSSIPILMVGVLIWSGGTGRGAIELHSIEGPEARRRFARP